MQQFQQQRVAIVTGAGNGLGRNHAMTLAKQGVKVVVNDMGVQRDGYGHDISVAKNVCDEIVANGGDAIPHTGSVTVREDAESMVNLAIERWGRLDILVNNAGILRDKSFAKMSLDDFAEVVDVHLMGTVNCCKYALPHMQHQQYGRIVVTTSSSGLYGNFGQSNYGAAKLAVVGFMNSLGIETEKDNIHINALSPIAETRMTDDIIPPNLRGVFDLDSVSNALLALCSDAAPNRKILAAGNQYFATAQIMESDGLTVEHVEQTAESLLKKWQQIETPYQGTNLASGPQQTMKFVTRNQKS